MSFPHFLVSFVQVKFEVSRWKFGLGCVESRCRSNAFPPLKHTCETHRVESPEKKHQQGLPSVSSRHLLLLPLHTLSLHKVYFSSCPGWRLIGPNPPPITSPTVPRHGNSASCLPASMVDRDLIRLEGHYFTVTLRRIQLCWNAGGIPLKRLRPTRVPATTSPCAHVLID